MRIIKIIIILLTFLSGLFLLFFTSILNNLHWPSSIFGTGNYYFRNIHIGDSLDSLTLAFISLCLGAFFNSGTYGLAYETSVEMVFPVASEVTAG